MAWRIQRSATISIDAPLQEAFPLFGPIREKEWAHGWDPQVIYPENCLVARHMVFRTQSQESYTWVIVHYEPLQHSIEYLVSASERIWTITVTCAHSDMNTFATVTYSYTGFNEEAHKRNEIALGEMFASDLKDWEKAINYYIRTGKQLTS
jgi:hypothetical protein